MRILVTAGPTREYFDDVRFISNASSGKLGYAIAAEAARRSHNVILVSGPVMLLPPEGVEFVPAITGRDMLEACRKTFESCDAAVMAAAVCDYRPAARTTGKSPKTTEAHSVVLEPTEDICATLGRMKERTIHDAHDPKRDREGACKKATGNRQQATGNEARGKRQEARGGEATTYSALSTQHSALDEATRQPRRERILMGFALETHDGRARAEAKLRRKHCDAIVLNHPAGIGEEETTIEVFIPGRGWSPPRTAPKPELAAYLVDLLDRLAGGEEQLSQG